MSKVIGTAVLAGGKEGTGAIPASGLDAGHRDGEPGLSGDQDGRVQDAVLLGPDQLLAFKEQSTALTFVLHSQVRHTALLRYLSDREYTGLHGLVGQEIVNGMDLLGEEREHGQ